MLRKDPSIGDFASLCAKDSFLDLFDVLTIPLIIPLALNKINPLRIFYSTVYHPQTLASRKTLSQHCYIMSGHLVRFVISMK